MMRLSYSWSILITVALGLILLTAPVLAQDLNRSLRNYQDVMSGNKKLEQLSPQEKEEVIIIHRRLQAQRYGTNNSPECRDAVAHAESAASELADYTKRLRNCAETQDYSDDCSTEFRRVRNAHSGYEDAVSSVNRYCR